MISHTPTHLQTFSQFSNCTCINQSSRIQIPFQTVFKRETPIHLYGGPVLAENTLNSSAEKSASINCPSDNELPIEYMSSTDEN